jgi:glutamyl-tRNA reductase
MLGASSRSTSGVVIIGTQCTHIIVPQANVRKTYIPRRNWFILFDLRALDYPKKPI